MAVQAPAAIQQFLWWKTGSLAKKSVEFPLFFVVHKTIRRSQYFIPFFMDVLLPGNFIFLQFVEFILWQLRARRFGNAFAYLIPELIKR